MASWRGWIAGVIFLTLIGVQVSESLVITDLQVPDVVEHDTNSTAILDCQYDFAEDDIRLLLVKWYLNDVRHLVYQWGFGVPASDSGVLKGRTHLGHVASPDPLKKHRAISVRNPTMEMSGKYICKVMTDSKVATASKKMIVYVPARVMNFTQDKPTTSSVNVTCLAEGLYPMPKLEIFAQQQGKPDSRSRLEDVETYTKKTEEGLFDTMAHRLVQDDELEGPTTFTCVLSMYDAPYSLRRDISYSSGINLAASTSGVADKVKSASVGVLSSCLLLALLWSR